MKLKIDNELLAEEFFEDTCLLGIVAPIVPHQFIWNINRGLNFDFRLNNDLEIQLAKKNRNYFFTLYEYREPFVSLTYYLYENLNDGEYLVPEFRHLDYLWLSKGDIPNREDELLLIQDLKKIPGVQLVVELNNEKIINKQHLIF
jgi:hypothetical protein